MAEFSAADVKIPLPAFLKLLTDNKVPPTKAMAVAHNVYKTYNTPSLLGQLTDLKLNGLGVGEKDVRKLVLSAIRKAGYKAVLQSSSATLVQTTLDGSGPSTGLPASQSELDRPKKKRKRNDDLNEFLPDRPSDAGETYGSLDFHEVLDDEALRTRSTVANRAPIMMAWAFVVAERLGFQREEALSIASVYTEMNAINKGVSLGIYEKGKERGIEASRTGSQPYVDLMGRRPLYQTASAQWRALSAGAPVAPTSAFSYITRSLRQTAPHVVGALRLLAASYPPDKLNEKGFGLYAAFRPTVDAWGKKAEVRCSTILNLRPQGVKQEEGPGQRGPTVDELVKTEEIEPGDAGVSTNAASEGEPSSKRSRTMTLEEYEAALDEDTTFDDFDLSNIP